MALAPVWITESGSLGVVPEGKFYRISLEAEDPDFPGVPSAVSYSLIAGALPAGVQVNTNGTIEGIPVSVADFKGVPSEVSENTTSKFAIRVIDAENRIADRTFTLTVSGQDKPEWITPAGRIGQWFDGTEMTFQFQATDLDPGDNLEITLIDGTLPEGISLSTSGALTGFITPLLNIVSGAPGYDIPGTEYEEFPYDFSATSINQNHQFTLKLTDGKDVVLRQFELFVYSRDSMTADSAEITVDTGNITADSIATRSPYITNNVPFIGRFRHDNYFAYKFDGADPDGDQIRYYAAWGPVIDSVESSNSNITVDSTSITADSSSLPLGLTLDPATGWLFGYLPDIGLTEKTYDFGVRVHKTVDLTNRSVIYKTSLAVFGNIDTEVSWITNSDLGIIDNGAISILDVEASHATAKLYYRLITGSAYNKLPQGLKLLPSGNIVGQVSFKTFSLDGSATTFDEDFVTRLSADPTTFDLTYTFTVEAYSLDGFVSVTKNFTILVNKKYTKPHNAIYCKATPPLADRELLDTLLSNNVVIPPAVLYRADDPNFGASTEVVYTHAYGLNPASFEDYVSALELNHYNKNLVLGEVKTARALDKNENVLYEVVYSQIVDTLVNKTNEITPRSVPIKYPAIDDGLAVNTVYPNSLANMREQVIDQIGQSSRVLPTWMLSKQEDGTIPGFTPAWVIAYTKPGKSKFVQYNIEEFFGTQLNLIDFEIDRYTLDMSLLRYWGIRAGATNITADSDILVSDSDTWRSSVTTTFDRSSTETLFDAGSCRFVSPVDIYDATDTQDKYIKFPRTQIINNIQ